MPPDQTQNTGPSSQPEQPPVNNQTVVHSTMPGSVKLPAKFTKKTKIITGAIVVLLILAGLVTHELSLARNYQTAYKRYIASLSYTYYADDMQTFLQSNNGVLAKMYDCRATATMVWNASNSTGSTGWQYTDLQNKIRTDLQTAQAAQPVYHSSILVSVLPQARHAHKEYTNLNNLFSATGSMLNSTGNDITPYCINRLYGPIVGLKTILADPASEYSKTDNLTAARKQDVGFEAQHVAKLKSNVSPHVPVPSNMAATENLFTNYFLTKLEIDLNSLLTIKNSNPRATSLDFGELNTSFAQDANEVNTVVMPEAALQAENIQPSIVELQTLLDAVGANN